MHLQGNYATFGDCVSLMNTSSSSSAHLPTMSSRRLIRFSNYWFLVSREQVIQPRRYCLVSKMAWRICCSNLVCVSLRLTCTKARSLPMRPSSRQYPTCCSRLAPNCDQRDKQHQVVEQAPIQGCVSLVNSIPSRDWRMYLPSSKQPRGPPWATRSRCSCKIHEV